MNYNQVSNLQNCCRCANPIGFCYHAGPCNTCEKHQSSVVTTASPQLPFRWQDFATERAPFLKIQKVENGYVVTHNGKEYVFESLIGIAYHFEPPGHQTEEG